MHDQPVLSEEHRQFHRIFYQAPAILATDSERYECSLIDISLKGCLLAVDNVDAIDRNDQFTFTLKLSDDVAINMDLNVAHVETDKIGFVCKHIDLDSISALRRLVESNLGDSALLERELTALSHYANNEFQ